MKELNIFLNYITNYKDKNYTKIINYEHYTCSNIAYFGVNELVSKE